MTEMRACSENSPLPQVVFLYGPSGSGKSTAGRKLAEALGKPFIDLDELIEQQAGQSIPDIFSVEGEPGFRLRERQALRQACGHPQAVIALGGGALLDAENRSLAEAHGEVICLSAPYEVLLSRLQEQADSRPLLSEDLPQRLRHLLEQRREHYATFVNLDTSGLTPEQTAWQIQVRLGWFRVRGMGEAYDVFVRPHGLQVLGEACRRANLEGPVALVSDEQVYRWYAGPAAASLERQGYVVCTIAIPSGEEYKTPATVQRLWDHFIDAGLERRSTVVALGGGVVNDIAGFAAATYLRGLRWVACPTSLLAMVDASLGGKTGVDLPQGKNLVGAFHSPALVLADTVCLQTLPDGELRSGMAEVVKHGVIADPQLFRQCADLPAVHQMEEVVRRAVAVKVHVIQQDPYEKGLRAVLNLGHTFGHALEQVTGYTMRHGEAVAIGMICAARLSHALGLAEADLEREIGSVLSGLNLPTRIPSGLDRAAILSAMRRDKKRVEGKLRFVLPVRIGEVLPAVEVDESLVERILW